MTGGRAPGRPWLVLRESERYRWGGDLRRRYLLDGLAERTGAVVVDGWGATRVRSALRGIRGPTWRFWGRPASVASTELLADPLLAMVREEGRAMLVDVHDHQVIQNEALGFAAQPDEASAMIRRLSANLDAFEWQIAPSVSFVPLAGLDPDRTLVATNGCDSRHIDRRGLPDSPVVGYLSGAAPGRGIETLIEAARMARSIEPELVLRLWLVATGAASQAYLDALHGAVRDESWIIVGSVAYADLPAALAQATILCVPFPPNDYMDTSLPVKLFDSLAAGRPVVVTPRTEMAALVREHGVGLVTEGDRPEDLAEAFIRLTADLTLAEDLGTSARRAAEEVFDWRIIGRRLADELLPRLL